MSVSIEQARSVKQKAGDLARQMTHVEGVGLTCRDGSYAIKINLHAPSATELPEQLDGVPIVYEVTGTAKKRAL